MRLHNGKIGYGREVSWSILLESSGRQDTYRTKALRQRPNQESKGRGRDEEPGNARRLVRSPGPPNPLVATAAGRRDNRLRHASSD